MDEHNANQQRLARRNWLKGAARFLPPPPMVFDKKCEVKNDHDRGAASQI